MNKDELVGKVLTIATKAMPGGDWTSMTWMPC